ncbi:60S ribosomal protein L20B [Tilletia horrida]|nr:60S ribosomal protein L20B [Tilletia horrida]
MRGGVASGIANRDEGGLHHHQAAVRRRTAGMISTDGRQVEDGQQQWPPQRRRRWRSAEWQHRPLRQDHWWHAGYLVIGRHLPTERDPEPTLYRMRIFAPNTTVAKSRFWYFVRQLRKMKKATGEIVAIHAIQEAKPLKVKNFGIWLRYNSRSGTHNMYKEFRTLTRADAVETMYQDMAARHRARFASIHILKVVELEKTADVRRAYIKQLLAPKLRFPLPHRRTTSRGTYAAKRPSTWC